MRTLAAILALCLIPLLAPTALAECTFDGEEAAVSTLDASVGTQGCENGGATWSWESSETGFRVQEATTQTHVELLSTSQSSSSSDSGSSSCASNGANGDASVGSLHLGLWRDSHSCAFDAPGAWSQSSGNNTWVGAEDQFTGTGLEAGSWSGSWAYGPDEESATGESNSRRNVGIHNWNGDVVPETELVLEERTQDNPWGTWSSCTTRLTSGESEQRFGQLLPGASTCDLVDAAAGALP